MGASDGRDGRAATAAATAAAAEASHPEPCDGSHSGARLSKRCMGCSIAMPDVCQTMTMLSRLSCSRMHQPCQTTEKLHGINYDRHCRANDTAWSP
jgi:hypothetical protein